MSDQVRLNETNDLYSYEEQLYDSGDRVICGIDEAGRGPLAGPVVVASCILPPFLRIKGLNDSKKLSITGAVTFVRELWRNRMGKRIMSGISILWGCI